MFVLPVHAYLHTLGYTIITILQEEKRSDVAVILQPLCVAIYLLPIRDTLLAVDIIHTTCEYWSIVSVRVHEHSEYTIINFQ